MSTRVYQRIKDALNNRAEDAGETLAGYTEKILNTHCNQDDNATADLVIDLKNNINQKKEAIQALNQKIKQYQQALKKVSSSNQHQEDYSAERNQLKGDLEQAKLKIRQLSQAVTIAKSNALDTSMGLSNSTRFAKHIEYLQKEFPNLSINQLMELSIACAYANEGSWTVYTLKDYIKRNRNFFTTKTTTNETSRS